MAVRSIGWKTCPGNTPTPPKTAFFENYRETFEPLPSGERILVGCSVLPELKELHRTALNSDGGWRPDFTCRFWRAAGGWSRVRSNRSPASARPPLKISAGDLSQRISVAAAESELGQLAAVLKFHVRAIGNGVRTAETICLRRGARITQRRFPSSSPRRRPR